MTDLVVSPALPRFATYTAAGGQSAFPIPFAYDQAGDIRVEVRRADDSGAMQVVAAYVGGDTAAIAPAGPANVVDGVAGAATIPASTAGDQVTVYALTYSGRRTQFGGDAPFLATRVNAELTRGAARDQELRRDLDRAVLMQYGQSALPLDAASLTGKLLRATTVGGALALTGVDLAAIDPSVVAIAAGWADVLGEEVGAHLPAWSNLIPAVDFRIRQTADVELYVGGAGASDANDGTAGHPFATLQAAFNRFAQAYDMNGHEPRIVVAAGTYTGNLVADKPIIGASYVQVIGDTTTPANVLVSTTSNDCFRAEKIEIRVKGVKVATTTGGDGFSSFGPFVVWVNGKIEHGAIAGSVFNGLVRLSGDVNIRGNFGAMYHAGGGLSQIQVDAVTLDAADGAYHAANYFCGIRDGMVVCGSETYANCGNITGLKYVVHQLGRCDVGNKDETWFPGDVAGYINTGGKYLGGELDDYIAPDNGGDVAYFLRSRNFNDQTLTDRIKLTSELFGGHGYSYMDGDGCFSSGETHLAGDAAVDVNTGTADGITFQKKAYVALNFPIFSCSVSQAAAGYFRRRTTDGDILVFYKNTTPVGSISVSGSATAYNTSCDFRLKDKRGQRTDAGEIIDAIAVWDFAWKHDGSHAVGVMAQELAKVVPEAVTPGDSDETRRPEVNAEIAAEREEMKRSLLIDQAEHEDRARDLAGIIAAARREGEPHAQALADLDACRRQMEAIDAQLAAVEAHRKDDEFRQWSVDYSKLVPYLIAEVQALRRRERERTPAQPSRTVLMGDETVQLTAADAQRLATAYVASLGGAQVPFVTAAGVKLGLRDVDIIRLLEGWHGAA